MSNTHLVQVLRSLSVMFLTAGIVIMASASTNLFASLTAPGSTVIGEGMRSGPVLTVSSAPTVAAVSAGTVAASTVAGVQTRLGVGMMLVLIALGFHLLLVVRRTKKHMHGFVGKLLSA